MTGPQEINLNRFDINLLVVFIDLWETRSVTLTSERLSLTQPAVSHALKRLRVALGDDVFLHSRAGLRPTPRAQQLVAPITNALKEIKVALSAEAVFDPGTARRDFRIAMSEIMELSVAPMLVSEIVREAPGVMLNLVPMSDNRTACAQLESGELQLTISSREIRNAWVSNQTLTELPMIAMLSKGIEVPGTTIPLDMYLDIPHVIIKPQDRRGSSVDKSLAELGCKRKVGAVVQNYMVMAAVAVRCGFICHLPRMMAEQLGHQMNLTIYDLPIEVKPTPVIVTSHNRYNADSGIAWLVQKTRDIIRNASLHK